MAFNHPSEYHTILFPNQWLIQIVVTSDMPLRRQASKNAWRLRLALDSGRAGCPGTGTCTVGTERGHKRLAKWQRTTPSRKAAHNSVALPVVLVDGKRKPRHVSNTARMVASASSGVTMTTGRGDWAAATAVEVVELTGGVAHLEPSGVNVPVVLLVALLLSNDEWFDRRIPRRRCSSSLARTLWVEENWTGLDAMEEPVDTHDKWEELCWSMGYKPDGGGAVTPLLPLISANETGTVGGLCTGITVAVPATLSVEMTDVDDTAADLATLPKEIRNPERTSDARRRLDSSVCLARVSSALNASVTGETGATGADASVGSAPYAGIGSSISSSSVRFQLIRAVKIKKY